jgi:hypothetical protein
MPPILASTRNQAGSPLHSGPPRFEPPDTIIVPAKEDSFHRVFIGEGCWYPIRLGEQKLKMIKWIAVYRTSPISAITHFARIDRIENYLETGRYKIILSEPKELQNSVHIGDTSKQSFQGQRYTTLAKLKCATLVAELRPWQ